MDGDVIKTSIMADDYTEVGINAEGRSPVPLESIRRLGHGHSRSWLE